LQAHWLPDFLTLRSDLLQLHFGFTYRYKNAGKSGDAGKDVVWAARLAERPATHGLSTGRCCDLCHERGMAWCGLKLYGRVNEATFRKVVLVLLLLSGAALVV
jgi:hypothetical protein